MVSTSLAWPAAAGQKLFLKLAPFLLLNPVCILQDPAVHFFYLKGCVELAASSRQREFNASSWRKVNAKKLREKKEKASGSSTSGPRELCYVPHCTLMNIFSPLTSLLGSAPHKHCSTAVRRLPMRKIAEKTKIPETLYSVFWPTMNCNDPTTDSMIKGSLPRSISRTIEPQQHWRSRHFI